MSNHKLSIWHLNGGDALFWPSCVAVTLSFIANIFGVIVRVLDVLPAGRQLDVTGAFRCSVGSLSYALNAGLAPFQRESTFLFVPFFIALFRRDWFRVLCLIALFYLGLSFYEYPYRWVMAYWFAAALCAIPLWMNSARTPRSRFYIGSILISTMLLYELAEEFYLYADDRCGR